jgi:hypothetical protein
MKYAIEMGSDAMLYISSFMQIHSNVDRRDSQIDSMVIS